MSPPLDDGNHLSTAAELQALTEAFPDVGFIVSDEGRYVRVLSSPDSASLLYQEGEALLGERLPEVLPDDVAAHIMDNIGTALATGDSQSFRYELDVREGQRWFEARVTPVEDGTETGYVVYVARDVTEQVRTRRELARERGYMQQMLDSLDDLFFALDADGALVGWNRAVEAVTGYGSSELERCALYELFGPGADRKLRQFVREVEETGSARRETTIETKRGAQIPYEFLATLFEDPDGERLVVGIGRDVGQRREREQQVQVFGRVLRHNMRNKMTVIESTAEYLRQEATPELATEFERIQTAGADLLALSEKAYDVTEVLLKQTTPEALDVGEIAAGVARDASERYPDATIRYAGPESAAAVAIPAIEDAVVELVENAVKHGDNGTTARITVEAGPPVLVRVADDGPGLPDHEASIITEEQTVSNVYHASGMGLWLVRWIVRRANGTVELAATDEGTEFVITLDGVD